MGTARPLLFRNSGAGDFVLVPSNLLSTFQSAQGLSPVWGDFDNDGDLDVVMSYVGSASKDVQLFLNDGSGGFTLGFSDTTPSTYVSAVDYDNDGRLDIFVTGWNSRCRLYRNLGGGTFTEVLNEPIVQDVFGRWPMAGWGDYDNDGFMDLLLAATDSLNGLYRNSSNGNHWLKVQLEGQVSNRAAIGAKVRVKAVIEDQEIWQMRVVQAQSSFTEVTPHFGLGNAARVETLRVEWPSGRVTEVTNVAVNQSLTITEPPSLGRAGMINGEFKFDLIGRVGEAFDVSTSSNLTDWVPWQTVTNTNRTMTVTDPSPNAPQRFYKAMPGK
jgi:hypothetical protein